MRNKEYLYSIATFLIALIISLPIYSSVVFAGLSEESIKGNDDIEGYVREDDTYWVEVTASVSGDPTIDPSQVRFTDESGAPFQACNDIGNDEFVCTYSALTSTISSNPFQLTIKLFNDGQNEDSSVTISGVKDVLGPEISSFSTDKSVVGDEDITFSYNIEERACESGCSGKCSGIDFLAITSGSYSKVIDINTNEDDCTESGTFTESVSSITSLEYGDVTVEAKAYDNFGQVSSTVSTTFMVDKSYPVIDTNSFKLLDNNKEIKFISDPITASASITISDSNLDYVTGDFSNLSDETIVKDATCTSSGGDDHTCTWSDINIDLSETETYNIQINATDTLNNTATATISYYLEVDDVQPSVTSIYTNHLSSNGTSYLGSGENSITAEIDESGIGFNNLDIYLDLSNINGNSNVQANNCTDEGSTWLCYWNNTQVTASDGITTISIVSTSADDLGNEITGTVSADVTVDTTTPLINSVSYTPENPISSDTLEFAINVTDSTPLSISINASTISTTDIHTGSCDDSDCTVEIDDIVSSYTQDNVLITAEDIAGNIATQEQLVTVYQSDSGTTPEFYSVANIELIPAEIDREIASQIGMYVYLYFELQSTGSGQIVGETVSCDMISGYLSEDPCIMNEGATDQYIVLKTDTSLGSYTNDSFPVNCTLRLNVKDETVVYDNYEEEEIASTLTLYGNALGDLDDTIQEKLDKINEEIEEIESDIEDYESWVSIFGTYCTIAQGIARLSQAWQTLRFAAWWALGIPFEICALCCATVGCAIVTLGGACACAAIFWAAWSGGVCIPANILLGMSDGFFWPPGTFPRVLWHWWTYPGWILKIACMVFYNCFICDWDSWINLAGEAISISVSEEGWSQVVSTGGGGEGVGSVSISAEGDADSGSWSDSVTKAFESTETKFGSFLGGIDKSLGRTPTTEAIVDVTGAAGDDGGITHAEEESMMRDEGLTGDVGDGEEGAGADHSWLYKWTVDGKKTSLDSIWKQNYMFNPYKSIKYAEKCWCLPAQIYNMKKDKEVHCMKRNCIENHLTTGQSTTVCDIAFKERECLYVLSAQYLKHDYDQMFDNLVWAILKYLASLLAGTIVALVCSKSLIPGANLAECAGPPTPITHVNVLAEHTIWCGLLHSITTYMEFSTILDSKFGFDGLDKMELEGESYC